MKRNGKKYKAENQNLQRAAEMVDTLALFERFQNELLPALQEEVLTGTPPKELRRKYLTHIQASQIMTALTDPDASKRLAAQKDILDREEGKATEKKEISHRLGQLPDKELEAILISSVEEMPDDEEV